MDTLPTHEWRSRVQAHAERLTPFARERNERRAQGVKHPVNDFLFEYYSFGASQLLRWTPGANVILEGATPADVPWKEFVAVPEGMVLRAADFPEHRVSYLHWALNYLESVAERPAAFGCFGLHEWAMVYHETTVRHAKTPLRLPPAEIAAVVEEDGVRCTHYDAYRFFSPDAVPLNRLTLTRKTTTDHDQKGCVHVTMDLYRFAYKIAPWCEAETLADAFMLAWEARQLDMRASPYELSAYGVEPLLIETRVGREEYVAAQRELARQGEPIRARLIEQYRRVLTGWE